MRRKPRLRVAPDVLELALSATSCAAASGAIEAPPTLTLIDYSAPLRAALWVFDLSTGELLFKELVSRPEYRRQPRNQIFQQMDSRQTSLGLFVTDDVSAATGLSSSTVWTSASTIARSRAIACTVRPTWTAARGGPSVGRSWGCPAAHSHGREVIDRIRGGGVIFSYYPDQEWLKSSRFRTAAAYCVSRLTATTGLSLDSSTRADSSQRFSSPAAVKFRPHLIPIRVADGHNERIRIGGGSHVITGHVIDDRAVRQLSG
jgi:hypothetical protein